MAQSAFGFILFAVRAEVRTVGVRREEVNNTFARDVIGNAARVAREVHREARGTVEAAVSRQHFLASRVQTGQTDSVFVCIRAAVGEEHVVHAVWCQAGDERGSFRTRLDGVGRSDRCDRISLVLNGLNDLGVLMPDVRVDQLR